MGDSWSGLAYGESFPGYGHARSYGDKVNVERAKYNDFGSL